MCVAAGAVLVAIGAQIAAAEPTREQVMEWARGEMARAEKPLDLAGQAIQYTVTYPASMTAEQVQRLRQEIAKLPDHPKQAVLTREERRLTLGPDVVNCEIFLGPDSQWRWNRTFEYPTARQFLDVAVSRANDWIIWPGFVTISDHTIAPPSGHDVTTQTGPLLRDVRLLRFGGLYADPKHFTVTGASLESGRWRITIASDAGHRLQVRARWDDTLARGLVEHAESWPAKATSPSASWDVGEWKEFGPGLFFASDIKESMPGSEIPARTLSFTGLSACDAARFAELVSAPTIGGADPIRGLIAPEVLYDYRPGSTLAIERRTDGSWVQMRPPGLPPEGAGLALKWIGWGALGVVVVTLAALRVRRGATMSGGTPA